MMEHSTTGLPIDNRTVAERAQDIVRARGYVQESELLRLVLPEGDGFDRKGAWSRIQEGPLTDGTLVMVWTRYGVPFYLTPRHAMRITAAGRMHWVEDKGETVPVVNSPSEFAL